MVPTAAEKVFLLLEYAKTQSIMAVQQSFQTKFEKDLPVRNSINQWHEKFQLTGVCAS